MPKLAETPGAADVYVTRQVHFNAGHRLYNPARTRAWNLRTYGPCSNANGHGHNYVLEATVRGPCDHRNLNKDVDFLKGVIPTAENLVVAFWGRIAPRIRTGALH